MLKQATVQSSQVPVLTSDRLILEGISLDDAEGVFDFASHDLVAKTVTWEVHASIEVSKAYITSVMSRISSEPGKIFLCWIVKSKDNQVLGLVTLTQLGPVRAQVGYVFHYDHWNRREPMDAVDLVLAYAFDAFPQLRRIQARCFPTSVSSRSLLEGLGFQFEGVNRGMMMVKGALVDLTCYAILRNQWNQYRASGNSHLEAAEHI